ncbi:DNA polymerase alpha catalytic subunit [Microthyrium microscopicum]|uniref:DNA polymerase n=1 Tax=Microthyrium microscopicum TaxID=703497 RepID=A0A6A6U1Q7_9PEZI|nr:DNA polymerase alpha catalytic subunit [Microthyrium microscopicum]
MASRAAALAQLRAARKSGRSQLDDFEVEEDIAVYDEVDDEDYKKIVRKRLDEDDFVVDDNGAGYADDGREEWDENEQYASESEEDSRRPGKHGAKRKREEDRERKEKVNNGISKYFSAKAAAMAPKPKAVPKVTEADDAFMNDLLGEVDVNVNSHRPMSRTKPVRDQSRRKTRVLSPSLDEAKPKTKKVRIQEPFEAINPDSEIENAPMMDDDDFVLQAADDDVPMSDPLPSSPVTKAVERKMQPVIKEEEEEDYDMMEITQAVGTTSAASVNMSGSRPVPKALKKSIYPTPVSSSPSGPASDAVDATAWTSVTSKLNVLSSPATSTAPSFGKLDHESAIEEDGSVRMFWFDFVEVKGSLCLFGKVKDKATDKYVSCFLKIDNIKRKLYFLPRETRVKSGIDTREEVSKGDVYAEVNELMSRKRIAEFKCKFATRKYAFELPNVPKEAEYLKTFYPYSKGDDNPPIPTDTTGETFSHVFGANTSMFEQFVLWKNIMGPCWLKIEGANFNAVTNASWCKLELQVDNPALINAAPESEELQAPPLTLMSMSFRTTFDASANKQEILIASARIYENISLADTTPAERLPSKTFTIMRPIEGHYPIGFQDELAHHKGFIGMEKTESALLSKFMAALGNADPDVLMGHKLDDVDIPILLNRLKERKTPGWHRIGRLRRSDWPKTMGRGGSNFSERQIVAGRLLCDLANDLGKSLMTKCQSWSLSEMCDLILRETRREIDNEQALKTWATTRQGLMQYLTHCEADTHFIAAIALKVQMLALSKQLTNLAGNSWARTLSGTRAERNEYILLHEFNKNKFICPDKAWGKAKVKTEDEENEEGTDAKKKDKFKGGLVFEPEKGLYDKCILVMDFNSLYPSIIQEYNICFTTVERSDLSEEDDKVPEVPADQDLGILPKLISTLVKRRREVKKLMKDPQASPDQLATWDIKQLALKLTANSMYGCLGYTKSRFYARPLAVLTTFKGREILRSTKDLAEEMQLRVIYGDTDSVMINTNMDTIPEALKFGREFKKAVNDRYKLLEIDIDNVFRRLLLHAKKKYAALNVIEVDGKFVEKIEVKGLDMRRREYCMLSKETSTKLLEFLLSGKEPDEVVAEVHDHLRQLATNMREYKIPVQKYMIYTQLGKDPKDYPNGNSMPSVQVALKLMAKGKKVKAKDVMSFVISGDHAGSNEKAAQNAFPLDEFLKVGSELKPDIEYYLHKQILPPVERLCAPISGTNVTQLADCLGLDTSKYRVSTVSNETRVEAELQPLESQIPDSVRFKDAAPLFLRCRACKTLSTFRGIAPSMTATPEEPTATRVVHDGLACPYESCGAVLPNLSIAAQLDAQIRQHVARYYAGWLVCDDSTTCGQRTRQMRVYGHRCLGPKGLGSGCAGKMQYEFTEKALYNQILYLSTVFDVEKVKERVSNAALVVDREVKDKTLVLAECNRQRFETARDVVKGYLDRNGRQWVQMDNLFAFARKA